MSLLQKRIKAISAALPQSNLAGIKRGIEKESLRVDSSGKLAQTAHSPALGSALTHPEITTDFSEALLEFITPTATQADKVLELLDNIHRYTYSQINSELLWVNSMPCMLERDDDIPVGYYGESNIGKMKTIYRLGLGHRYGRKMQAIAGVHYNFSLPDEFWQFLSDREPSGNSLQEVKNTHYFNLIRNFRRYFWLLLYLFGASPAVCRSFVEQREHTLTPFGNDTFTMHSPYATSLRMGDLGYQSTAQQSLFICYNDLQSYIKALCNAITQPYARYETIGLKDANGDYKQLNTAILQIENEFYSPVRPKRTTHRGETALRALAERGVEYMEVRCLDLNPFDPLGIDQQQIHFLDTFLLFCLLKESPPSSTDEFRTIQENQQLTVYRGRDSKLQLRNGKGMQKMREWGNQLLREMEDVAALLDSAFDCSDHQRSLKRQREKIIDSELTPSAQVLREMHKDQLTFFQFAQRQAQRYAREFQQRPLDSELNANYQTLATESIQAQEKIEGEDDMDFENYLAKFYAQYQCGK